MSHAQSGAICFYPDGTRRIRSALLVDFDNVFLTLHEISEEAALHFANEPRRWLAWLEKQRLDSPDYDKFHRRIVVKRCYLNPNSFWRFRPFFVRSGFETVDCPPLTQQGKTSADIHIVIDALELMQQDPRIDEFILLSTDADYTPVLRRIARGDRHIMVLAVGDAAAAYKSACDLLVDQEKFVDVLLGDQDDEPENDVNQGNQDAGLPRRTAAGPVPPPTAQPRAIGPQPAPGAAPQALIKFLEKFVGDADRPLTLAGAAAALRKNFGHDVVQTWSARGLRFKDFLEEDDEHSFQLSAHGPGYIYDPKRHAPPAEATSVSARTPAATAVVPDAISFARRVHEVTDIPHLSPEQYARVFQAVADEVNANGFHIMGTPKGARDRCTAAGQPVARAAITMVVRLIARSGHPFSGEPESACVLQQKFKKAAAKLCSDAGWQLDQAETELLDAWFGLDGQQPAAEIIVPEALDK